MGPSDKMKAWIKGEADPETRAELEAEINPDAAKTDEAMLRNLGITEPRGKVVVMRAINAPQYAFFKSDTMELIRTATTDEVLKAVDKAKGNA